MDIRARLEALAAAPKLWRVTATFSDGKVIILDQPTQAQADAHAKGKRRWLGKAVATKDGRTVTLDSVTVARIAEAN
jgi:hypothetical protein